MACPSITISLFTDYPLIIEQAKGTSTTSSSYVSSTDVRNLVRVGNFSNESNSSHSESSSSRQIVTLARYTIPDNGELSYPNDIVKGPQESLSLSNTQTAERVDNVAGVRIQPNRCSLRACLRISSVTMLNLINVAWMSAIIYFFSENKEPYSTVVFGFMAAIPINGLLDYCLARRQWCRLSNQN